MAGAYEKIEAHEDLCAERYRNIHGRIDASVGELASIKKLLQGVALGLLAFMGVQLFQSLTERPAPPAITVLTPPPAAQARP